jgi:hypothetical protein
MKKSGRIAALSVMCLLLVVGTVNGGDSLTMRVSPAVALAPGFLTVVVTVEADSTNRWLEIVAESHDFYRSSQIQLDGEHAPRFNRFEFRNLPTGLYQVTGVLIGTKGPRAMAQRVATVAPAPGSGR